MEHAVPSKNFQRENGTTFSEVPLFPEIFQWNKPKNHVPFTTQPEFPESLGKWKTPHKYSCSSAISTLAGKENKRRLQTLSIDNAWSNKNFLVYLTFRMLQHTSSEVNGYNCYKHLKIQKIKRGTGDKIKITMTKLILPIVDTTGRN